MSDTKGGTYYKDHLPLLGEKRSVYKNLNTESNVKLIQSNIKRPAATNQIKHQLSDLNLKSVSNESLNNKRETKQQPTQAIQVNSMIQNNFSSAPSCPSLATCNTSTDSLLLVGKNFKLGDRVNIDLNFELVQTLQVGHGGWCDAMFESLGNTGILTGIDSDNDFEVTYPSGNKWTFNPSVLTRVVVPSEPSITYESHASLNSNSLSSNLEAKLKLSDAAKVAAYSEENDFQVGDIVQICSDNERMKVIQKGHGEWAEAMQPTLGKIGRISHIYPDCDLKIELCGTTWTYSPLAVTKISSQSASTSASFEMSVNGGKIGVMLD